MLEFYYKYPRVLRRLRAGALGNEMDRIAAHFCELGYKPASAKIYISRLAKFSAFAAGDARSARIEQDVIDRFLLGFRTETPRISAATAIGHPAHLKPQYKLHNIRLRTARNALILLRFISPLRVLPGPPPCPASGKYYNQ